MVKKIYLNYNRIDLFVNEHDLDKGKWRINLYKMIIEENNQKKLKQTK